MTTDEPARLHLYEQARGTWGQPAADYLMRQLPHDADRLATKVDLAVTGAELRAEIGSARAEIARSAATTVRTLMLGTLASNATMVGLVFAAVRLT